MVKINKPTIFILLAIELIISIAIFSFCISIAINILINSYLLSNQNELKIQAVIEGKTISEYFKSTQGSLESLSELLGVPFTDNLFIIYYDTNWNKTDTITDNYIEVHITDDTPIYTSSIVQIHINNYDQLITWEVEALKR